MKADLPWKTPWPPTTEIVEPRLVLQGWVSCAIGGHLGPGLQVTQLHGLGLLGQHSGRLQQRCRGLLFAFGVDHLGASLAFGFGLARNGPHHRLIQIDVLDSTLVTLIPP